MPTILSRFDMIFIVKDEHEQSKDMVSSCCGGQSNLTKDCSLSVNADCNAP